MPETLAFEHFTAQECKVYPHMCFYFGRTCSNAVGYRAFRSHKNIFVSLTGITVPFFLTDLPASRNPLLLKLFAWSQET